ncbi:serpin B9-like isoform X1 [Cervus elaphus]|uniref:serpin B9-like isoform X1 n=2 Tax=Cervus canadensis TaxID=1574408 RepID=UPI0018B66789|nr:serpin B9-like isoform X1 [Cervus canadensis]XP_043764601.1 serpin B9-like isoform X1 [Cervus elaphus]
MGSWNVASSVRLGLRWRMLMEERREPSNPGSVSDSRPGLMDALCEANGTFALRLLKALCEDDPSGNVFFSPVSLSSVLAMVLLGAKGDTAAQVAQALSLNTEKEFHQDFQQLLAELNKPDAQYLLTTANRIFGEKTYEFLSTFKESCLRFYYAELEQLSFAEAAEPSRKQINAWVSKKTEGKIPELLPANSINAETRLILVNAVYFKGRWSEKFDKEYTREMPFRINQKEQRPVQMMFQDGVFRLARIQEVQAQVLELPYADEELSMLVLLPNDHVPLSSVEKHLTWEKFLAWTQPHSMKKTQVEVFLPKFKLEMTYDMVSVLQGLGVLEAFQSGRADFSAMSPSEGLCLSALAHKSVVEVDEEGTEAAAASAMLQVDSCMVNQPRFCADHPFLFFIRHNGSRSTLFCGRFSSP